MKNVIEKLNGETRVWWTGSEWSSVDTDAMWYDDDDAEAVANEIGGSVTYFE